MWIRGLAVMLLLQVRGDIAVLPAVTAVLLHHSAMDKGTDCNFVSTGKRGNGVSACGFCSTVTSISNDLSSTLYHNIVQYLPSVSPLTKYIHLP